MCSWSEFSNHTRLAGRAQRSGQATSNSLKKPSQFDSLLLPMKWRATAAAFSLLLSYAYNCCKPDFIFTSLIPSNGACGLSFQHFTSSNLSQYVIFSVFWVYRCRVPGISGALCADNNGLCLAGTCSVFYDWCIRTYWFVYACLDINISWCNNYCLLLLF